MSYFMVDPKDQKADLEERVRSAAGILESAIKAYERDPSRLRRIDMLAAQRSLKEVKAQWQEWTK